MWVVNKKFQLRILVWLNDCRVEQSATKMCELVFVSLEDAYHPTNVRVD